MAKSTADNKEATQKKASTARKTPAKQETASKPRAPRKTPKIIRNLRGTVVHARLYSQNPKDPFRVELKPRGQQGDTTVIPVSLIDDGTFLQGVDVLWEVITEAEYRKLQYGPVGYLGRTDAAVVIRPEDTTVATAKDWDGKGRRVPQEREIKRTARGQQASERDFGTGMHTIDVPGSDAALHAALEAAAKAGATTEQLEAAARAGASALPPEANFGRRVVIERVQGE